MEAGEIDSDDFLNKKRTTEEIAKEWRNSIDEIGLSPVELADIMKKNCDYRPYQTILRGIQRMISGESRVSGEMFVIVRMLLKQNRRLKYLYPNLNWKSYPSGSLSTKVSDFTVWLSPQTNGRWIVSCKAPNGFSPPFGRWQNNLDAAKNKALVCVEEGMNDVAELELEAGLDP